MEMKIEREDVARMKTLARRVAAEKDPLAIHELEHGFVDFMTAKYGKQTAITMLTKVWKLSAMLRPVPEREV